MYTWNETGLQSRLGKVLMTERQGESGGGGGGGGGGGAKDRGIVVWSNGVRVRRE